MNKPFSQNLGGIALTLVLHCGLLAALIINQKSCTSDGNAFASNFEEAETIEASLAFTEVKKKNKQPQKQRKKKFKAAKATPVSRDADALPKPKKEDQKPKPDEDEIDPLSILEKNRKQEEDLSDTGVDELPTEGSAQGSEWGTERDARGDPYVGELKGRIFNAWEVPTLETGDGRAVGCVRLQPSGTIKDRELKRRSSNVNLNRSVQLALKNASDMESSVPGHLTTLLTEKGICFNFVLE